MRTNLFFITLCFAYLMSAQSRQNDLVTVNFTNQTLNVILDSVGVQTGYFFSYNSDILPKGSRYTIDAENEPIDLFLSRLLYGTGLTYAFYKDQIILTYAQTTPVIKRKNFFSVSGKVLDENGHPMQNVNIFLDGTSIGTFSDIDGNYKLESIPPGFYDLVFSHIGYENAVYQLSEYDGDARVQGHKMGLDMTQLEEVEVISSRISRHHSSWLQHYEVFKKELLGSSSNANQCVIENPEVLNFSYSEMEKTLVAYTSGPLIIRNDALGYRINYFLESFRKNENDLRYRGKINFRMMEPLKSSEKRKWRSNREASFEGSFHHFKRALINNDLKKQGFRIYHLSDIDHIVKDKANEITAEDILSFKGTHYEMDFKKYLLIEYRKENESNDFLSDPEFSPFLYERFITEEGVLMKDPGNQLSVLRLLKRNVRMDMSGQILDKFALSTFGYWSWERLSDLVPINYDPKLDDI